MRTGIYCGSFDPVHAGHVAIMGAALASGYVDEVVVVPTGNYWDKKGLTDLVHRVKMLELVVPAGVRVAGEYSEYVWTNELFMVYGAEHPAEELVLLIGADNLGRFEEWRDYRSLLKYDFFVVPRGGFDGSYVTERMAELGKANYLVAEGVDLPFASSLIREGLNGGAKEVAGVDGAVLAYISTNHLYGYGE